MKDWFSRLLPAIFFASVILVPRINGQTGSIRGFVNDRQPRLPVSYASFASDSAGMVHLELYYQIYNSVLQFQPAGDAYEADYEMSVIVRDKKGNRVAAASQKKKVKAASEQQAQSSSDFRVKQTDFDLLPGKYEVEFALSDENSSTVIRRELKLKVNDFVSRLPTLSDIELVQAAGPRQENAESFAKGDLTVVPSVTGGFGGDENSRLLYYHEIYRGSEGTDMVRMETVLRSKTRGMVYRDTLSIPLPEPTLRQLREITLSDFPPGDYELEVVLRGRRNKKLDAKRGQLHINWSTEALLKHDYKTAVDQLAYIAPRDETRKLKKLKTYEERRQAFHDFWLERDPTPETSQNEVRIEFYRRVRIATQQFTVMRKEGWRTDRGRIYIQFGEPDQIDDYPVAAIRRPYQEWHYYRRSQYRKFTFVDEFEDGDYRLQFPYDGLYQRPDF